MYQSKCLLIGHGKQFVEVHDKQYISIYMYCISYLYMDIWDIYHHEAI